MNTVSLLNNYSVNKSVKNSNPSVNISRLNNEMACDAVSFTGKKKSKGVEEKKKSSFIHKALIATVGCTYPGLGQALNGQWGKAAMFAFGTTGLAIASFMINPLLAPLVFGAVEVAAFVDAYRNA